MNEWLKKIQDRTKAIPVASGRTDKFSRISFSDLVFLPGQLTRRPVDYFKEEISAKTVVGRLSQKPLELEVPVVFGAMSFGALSKKAKASLAKASKLAGTIANTGEGGMLPEERANAAKLIVQYSTGRFGIDENVLKQADCIEIKIGQGAKGGQGGLLPKDKVTDEIAAVRKVPKGEDIHSPAYHKDIENVQDLKAKVAWLRELSGGVPIIIKMAASDVENDVKIAVEAEPDIIALDGMEGGTGAAPEVMLNETGIPTMAGLALARKTLDSLQAKQELWIGGGFNTGGDVAKAIALGANAVFMAFPLLVSMGCAYCRQCYLGKCPRGLATQDEELIKNLDEEKAVGNVVSFIRNVAEEAKMLSGACGKNKISDLTKDDLRALTFEAAKVSGVRMVGE